MLVYYFIYLLGFFLLSFSFRRRRDTNIEGLFFLIVSLFLSFVAALRDGVGADYANYLYYFEAVNSNYELADALEPGYLFLNKIVSQIGLGFPVVALFSSLIMLFSLYIFLKKMGVNVLFGLAIYIGFWFFGFHFNIVRHGLSASIVLVSFCYIVERKFIKYLLCVALASLFHKVALVFIPLYWLMRINISLGYGVAALFFAWLVGKHLNWMDLSFFKFILPAEKHSMYQSVSTYSISLGMILNTTIWVYCRIIGLWKTDYLILLNGLLFSLLFALAFNNFSIFVERISGVLLLSLVGILPVISQYRISKKSKLIVFVFFWAYYSLLFNKSLHSRPTGDSYQYIPYRSIL